MGVLFAFPCPQCRIDHGFVIKVADFGLSVSMDLTKEYFRQSQDESIKLPIKWMALESMNESKFSEKSDVVSADYAISACGTVCAYAEVLVLIIYTGVKGIEQEFTLRINSVIFWELALHLLSPRKVST